MDSSNEEIGQEGPSHSEFRLEDVKADTDTRSQGSDTAMIGLDAGGKRVHFDGSQISSRSRHARRPSAPELSADMAAARIQGKKWIHG